MRAGGFAMLAVNAIHTGDARDLLPCVEPESIALAMWSPPYGVGKAYEADLTFDQWHHLITHVIRLHQPILRPGGFLAINAADILVFPDPAMPRFQAANPQTWRSPTRAQVLAAVEEYPAANRRTIAAVLGTSEQTIDRRLHGNNIRGGKHAPQTRVRLVGGLIEAAALNAGLYLYDRRVWVKDPAWVNSPWHNLSYRAVDECEYVFIFWKPGEMAINRDRLPADEWAAWGSRAVWHIPSVRSNDDHPAKFPLELPRRVIRLLSDRGDTVLDCFLGSGTTAVAAIETDRQFIGIEQHPGYADAARAAVATVQRRLF